MAEHIEDFLDHILQSDEPICEHEELGYNCNYPDCTCINPPFYPESNSQTIDVYEMMEDPDIDDAFYGDDEWY